MLITLSPVGEQPELGKKGITRSAEEASLVLCIWPTEGILPSPTQRMLERLMRGSLVAGRSSWHPVKSEMQMIHFLRTRDLRLCSRSLWSVEKGAQLEAEHGERKCLTCSLPKHFTTENSQYSCGNVIISISYMRRMNDTVVHRVKNKFPGFYF